MATEFLTDHPEFLNDFLELSFSEEYPLAMRASRVVYLFSLEAPELIGPQLKNILNHLQHLKNESAIRNLLHIFDPFVTSIGEDELGKLVDLCFRYLEDPSRAIAIRAYSLKILLAAGDRIPEIKSELLYFLEFAQEEETVSFRKLTNKVIKQLRREIIR